MTPREVLARLVESGLSVVADGEVLRLRAPAAPPAELVELARAHKPALLALVAEHSAPKPYIDVHGDLVVPADCDPALCWWKGGRSIADTLDDLDAGPETRRQHEPLH